MEGREFLLAKMAGLYWCRRLLFRITRRPDRAFVAEQLAVFGVSEEIRNLDSFSIDLDVVAHEPDTVTIVNVPVPVDDRKRLDRLAVQLAPAVDGEALRLLEDSGREDYIFLVANS
jgi:hypothetical protein